MIKPNALRMHLLDSVQELTHDPDRLLTFIENGKARCTAAAGLSFEYEYNLQIIITDYAGHPNTVMIPIIDWVRTNQPELLANFDKNRAGIQFDAEIMSNDLVDLSIVLPLTERVIVKEENGQLSITHPPEPLLTPHYPQQNYDIVMAGEDAGMLQSGPAEWHALETPQPKRKK